MHPLAHIFVRILLPGLLLVALGAALQRRRRLDITTLAALNLYLFVPAFLLVRIAESGFAWSDIGRVGAAVLLPMALVGVPVFLALRAARLPAGTAMPLLAGGLFSNAGNFGIPVAQLAFGYAGGEIQALVVLFMNTTVFLLGSLMLGGARGSVRGALAGYFKLPMFYMIALGLALRASGVVHPSPPDWLAWVWKAARLLAEGMVPIALVTLGAQIATRPRWPRWRVLGPVVALKLVALPAAAGLVVWWLGLWPWPGAQLVLAAAAPTAVNTLLLAVEVDADAPAVADAVFWTTLLSAGTVTVVLVVLRTLGSGLLPSP